MPFLGRQLTNGEALSLLSWVGFRYNHGLINAACVMGAESARFIESYHDNLGMMTDPVTGEMFPFIVSTDRGLFQINDKAHPTLSDEDAYRAIPNAAYAYELSQHGERFTMWAAFNSKSYLRYKIQVLWFYHFGRAWRARIPHVPELFG